MSNKTESKGARRRGLAWILSILMMGSMITLAVTMILERI